MLSSLPFILILLLQGFARHDAADLLGGSQDSANAHAYVRNIRTIEGLLTAFSMVGKEGGVAKDDRRLISNPDGRETTRFDFQPSFELQDGFLQIQRSRDGPTA